MIKATEQAKDEATARHTPGEWMLAGPTIRANGYNIGSVNSHRTSEGRANGCLIIAAPRLLAELKAIYAELDDIYDVDEESGTGK
jgi:hypothetical protein